MSSIVSDDPDNHEHICESFHIDSDFDKLISAQSFLTEAEILPVKELSMPFGKFTIIFSKLNCHNMHELILKHPLFWQSIEHWDTLVRRRECLHSLINKQLQQ